jgi:uncharacterized protein YggE
MSLPGYDARRWRRMKILPSIGLAVACSVVGALVVVAAGRQQVLVTTAAVTPVASSGAELGVISSGDATVSKKPDLAFISVGVESQASSASAAQSDLAAKASKLIARAKALGIADKDLNTSGYSIGPYYADGSQTTKGYRAAEQLFFKWHNVDTAGKTLDALVQEGGATNVSIGFGLADPKVAQAEARALAIGDAHSRAQGMAAAAGVKLGQVVRISDVSFAGYPSAGYDMKAAATPISTQIPVGELNVTVTVEVAYAIG